MFLGNIWALSDCRSSILVATCQNPRPPDEHRPKESLWNSPVSGVLGVLGPVVADEDRQWFLRFKSCGLLLGYKLSHGMPAGRFAALASSPSFYLQPPTTVLTILSTASWILPWLRVTEKEISTSGYRNSGRDLPLHLSCIVVGF